MVKGETFSYQLFENEAFRHFINTFLNEESGITKGCALNQTSNSITVGEGYFVIKGGFLREKTGTTLNLPSVAGYYKLVYEIDLTKINTKLEFNQGSYKFIRSVGDYPALIQQDLDNGGDIYQFEFCQFRITESGIADYADKRTFLDFDNIYKDIKKTIEGIEDTSDIVFKHNLDYSTEEKLTGATWIDGKPIYRKVVDLGTIGKTNPRQIVLGNNYDTIINFGGYIYKEHEQSTLVEKRADGLWRDIYYVKDSKSVVVAIARDASTSWSDWKVKIVVEYTKTTD